MKKLLALLLMLSVCRGIAQIPTELSERLQIKTWGSDTLDRGFFILPNKKSFILTGITFREKRGQLNLTVVDQNLKVRKERTFKSRQYDFCFAGVNAGNDNFILSGFTVNKNSNRDAWLVKINSQLDTLWTRSFGGNKNDQVYETIATHDGNYIAIGQTESWGNGDIDALVIKFNTFGEILWHKTYGNPKLDRTYSAIELDNGDLIVSGITNDNYPGNSDILLLRITPKGDQVWMKTFGGPNGDIAHSMHKRADNTFFTVGYSAETSAPSSDPLIMHFNENGEVIGKHMMSTGEEVKLINGYLNNNGQYIGTGFSRKAASDTWDTILTEFDFTTSKMKIKKVQLSDKDEECGYHMQAFDDRHALIYGHTMSGTGDNLLIKWRYR